MATVQQIYIAIFGRPADPVGLAYWNEQTNNGADLSAMIAAFTAAPEYEARFEGQSNEEIISSIYQSLFGREPDDEGLEFYAEALANGELPIETIAVRILDGAQNEDQTSIENKTEAADKFTASIDTPEEIEAYQGTQAATEAQEFLETVNEDPESVPSDEDVDQAVKEVNEGDYNPPEEEPEEPGGPGGDGNGVIRALTSDNDTISTGSGDDVINASAKNSLNIGDVIDGGDGDDELNISAGAIADNEVTISAPLGGPTISNVEIINNSHVGGNGNIVLNLTGVKGAEEVWTDFSEVKWFETQEVLDGLSDYGTNIVGTTYDDPSSSTVFGISNVAAQLQNTQGEYEGTMAGRASVNFAGADGTLNLALSGNAEGSYSSAGLADSFSTINIHAAAGNSGTLGVSATAESISVTGSGDLDFFRREFSSLNELDASKASGDISFGGETGAGDESSGVTLTDDFSITGGSGNDAFDLSTVSVNGSVDGGDGDDVISGGSGDDVISGGSGSNTIILGGVFTKVGSGEEVTFQAATAADLVADSDHSETFVLKQQSDAELDGGAQKPEFESSYPDADYGGDTVNIDLSESFDTTVYGLTLGGSGQADTLAFTNAEATGELSAEDLGVVSITLSSNETPYTDVFLEGEAREIFTFTIGIDTNGDDTADSTLTLVDVIGSTSKSMTTSVNDFGDENYAHLDGIEDLADNIDELDNSGDYTLATLFSEAADIKFELGDGGFEELLNFVGSNFTVDGDNYI